MGFFYSDRDKFETVFLQSSWLIQEDVRRELGVKNESCASTKSYCGWHGEAEAVFLVQDRDPLTWFRVV